MFSLFQSDDDGDEGMELYLIIIIVILCVLVVAVVAALVIWRCNIKPKTQTHGRFQSTKYLTMLVTYMNWLYIKSFHWPVSFLKL